MLRFVNIQYDNMFYEGYLLVETLEDLNKYTFDFRMPQYKRAKESLSVESQMNSRLGEIAAHIFKFKTNRDIQLGGVLVLSDLMGNVWETQARMILDGKKLAVNQHGGYFPLANEAVIEELERNTHKTFKPVL